MSQADDAAKVQGVDPSVNFLYKTMLQRDPKKRRVKLVQKHMVQVDFDLDDSEEDSDFDIDQHHDSDSLDDIDEEEKAEMLDLGAQQAGTTEVISVDNSEDDTSNAVHDSDEENEEEDDREDAGSDDDDADADDNESDDAETDGENDDDDNEDEDDDEDDDDGEEEDSEGEESDDEMDVQTNGKPSKQGLGGIFAGMETSDEEDEDYVPQFKKKKKKATGSAKAGKIKVKSPEPSSKPPSATHDTAVLSEQGQGRIKVLICCVCLSDQSADDDEIVECDNCGISVHEGCYGISESHSMASTESSASTEPWFCDACKAGVTPHCELCPNSGGIYKETDAGKWVHIVCALYTPGVAFGDVDRLCPVTLFEMPYSKWGARECSLCEDVRFSRTGVCICCDAGMCRSYFHVTCAQREGLLTEAAPEEVMDIADPFFAYCKQHADKMTVKARRRHWLAIQSHVRSYTPKVMDDEKEQARFQRKLNRHREKYGIARNKRPPSWVPTQKMVRHLHTSPYAVKAFMRKAELMGVVTHVENAHHEKPEARKKPHITPGLSTEFIQYYFGRNTKIDNLRSNLKELTSQNSKLQDQEKVLRHQYEQLSHDLGRLRESSGKYRREGERLWSMLSDMSKKEIVIPEIFRPKKRQRSPSKKETPCSPPALIQQCGICSQTTDQHLLAKCDSCHQHYHLGCLDPPLTRMPKKTKLMGWQCSQCVSSGSEDSEGSGARLVDEPRRLRETIKEPIKFRHMQSAEFETMLAGRSNKKKKIKKKPVQAGSGAAASGGDVKSPVKIPSEQKKGETKKPQKQKSNGGSSQTNPVVRLKKEDESTICVVCNQTGDSTNTVRCDECLLSYHFHCLDPPVKKSPKVRGYTWHCEACDPTDLSEEEEEMEESSEAGNDLRESNQPAACTASLAAAANS